MSQRTRIRVGDVFGSWTVLDLLPDNRVSVRCVCGTVAERVRSSLYRRGSCGCVRRAVLRVARTTHGGGVGGHKEPEYVVWRGMVARCEDLNHIRYAIYGGRHRALRKMASRLRSIS